MIDCHTKRMLINSNGQNYRPCLFKFSLAQRCPGLSDQGMSRTLLCHGLDSRGEQPHWGSWCIRCFSTSLWLPKCSRRCCMDAITEIYSWALGWAVEGLCLSPLWLRKNGLWDALFLSFLCLLFSIALCSEWWKKVNQLQWFQQSFKYTVGSNAGLQMPGLFQHYSTSWTAEKENSRSVYKLEKLNSWRARRVGREHAGAEGRRR